MGILSANLPERRVWGRTGEGAGGRAGVAPLAATPAPGPRTVAGRAVTALVAAPGTEARTPAPGSDQCIRVENITHVYGRGTPHEVPALRGVRFEVAPGEFLAIVGHNGSGKSTVAKHLNALLRPTEGDVWVDGLNTRDPRARTRIRELVGMVFQNPDNQIIGTTVEDDVAFGPENLGVPPEEIEERIEVALKLLGISHLRHEPPHSLSGGQKQRVAIAGVLAMRPHYVVLDEPTALLDPTGRAEVLENIVRLNREEGLGVVWITHFMEEVVHAHRVLVMEAGQVVMAGTPREVFARSEEIRQLRLDVPLVAQVAAGLRARGIDVGSDVVTLEELVRSVCQSRSKA